jgi:hypothetical protein
VTESQQYQLRWQDVPIPHRAYWGALERAVAAAWPLPDTVRGLRWNRTMARRRQLAILGQLRRQARRARFWRDLPALAQQVSELRELGHGRTGAQALLDALLRQHPADTWCDYWRVTDAEGFTHAALDAVAGGWPVHAQVLYLLYFTAGPRPTVMQVAALLELSASGVARRRLGAFSVLRHHWQAGRLRPYVDGLLATPDVEGELRRPALESAHA